MILVTGATGNNGVKIIRLLSWRGFAVRGFVRDRTHARSLDLPGVELVEGDFARPETFAPALAGVDRLFLLIPSSPGVEHQQCAFVDAAKQSGVRHIVKLSQLGADANSPCRFQRYHGVVEHYIRNSGLNYTFLRPNLFMQELLNFRWSIATRSVFCTSAGNAKISVVDVRDIAAIAALALTEPGHEGKTYEITGPESLTHTEMARLLSRAIGKQVKYLDVSLNAMKQALSGLGLPAWQTEGLVEDYELYRNGYGSKVTTTVKDVTGTAPMSFAQFAHDYSAKFRYYYSAEFHDRVPNAA